ncbi:putative histidine kinase group protein [Podospora appendiculata]|uniref:Histidine kinase group protein n=1 Tax=Podospora appendiculata TaxID=314037 RepID=A0AAE1CC03_9PEZI|nr:putative histidine kinase group protein [Podospora appendiculata]
MARNKKAASKEPQEDKEPANGRASPAAAAATATSASASASASTTAAAAPAPTPSSIPSPTIPPTISTTAPRKTGKSKAPAAQPQSSSALIICRNKHWRYISSFHGPWLQLPPEILETLANMNYNTPRPRPIDPAVFFDLVKIRRLVDEATNLAVRAASGVASIAQQNVSNSPHHAAAFGLGFGFGPGGHTKLSRERKHRMREQATQKLARAYHLDEIACSVATMQSASSLEEVASLVLQRSPQDAEAKYVHFFHEKIPSRQLAECTNLTTLDEIIADRPTEGEPLRTRATVRVFKEDFEGAASDLTGALKLHRLYRPPHTAPKPQSQQLQPYEKLNQRNGRWQEDVILKEEDQPSSLEIQLLFQRAGVYLSIASQHVAAAFPHKPFVPQGTGDSLDPGPTDGREDGDEPGEAKPEHELTRAEKEAQAKITEARKLVRLNAKRALRDYMAYLSHFEYSPNLSIDVAEEFARKVNYAANGVRMPRSHAYQPRSGSPANGEVGAKAVPHRIYTLSDLFAPAPPPDLPPYPSTELATARSRQPPSPTPYQTTTETLTYHPLLTDALHSLLLCHCMVQTSAKELLRHAYMVARLARLADGYPVFQASRSPARADWMEVLRACGNWIQLAGTWEDLCAPAPLPLFQTTTNGSGASIQMPMPSSTSATLARQAKALAAPGSLVETSADSSSAALVRTDSSSTSAAESEHQRKERIRQQAIYDALGDDRVNDESSFRLAIRARQLRAERDYRLDNAVAALDAKLTRREQDPASASVDSSSAVLKLLDDAPSTSDEAQDTSAADGSKDPQKTTPAADSRALTRTSSSNSTSTTHGKNGAASSSSNAASSTGLSRRWATDDIKADYPISTDRATAVARWVNEAPLNAGLGTGGPDGAARRRKKRPVRKAGTTSTATTAGGSSRPEVVGDEDRAV